MCVSKVAQDLTSLKPQDSGGKELSQSRVLRYGLTAQKAQLPLLNSVSSGQFRCLESHEERQMRARFRSVRLSEDLHGYEKPLQARKTERILGSLGIFFFSFPRGRVIT